MSYTTYVEKLEKISGARGLYPSSLYVPTLLGPFTTQVEVEGSYPENAFSELVYLSAPLFTSQELFVDVWHAANSAKAKDMIASEKIWLGIYFHKELQEGWHPKIKLRWMGEPLRFGVFAAESLKACSFVGEYTGLVEEEVEDASYSVRYPSWVLPKRRIAIQAAQYGNFTRFINHSDAPNVMLMSVYWKGIPRMILLALQTIHEGTQLTFDYGASFWKENSQIPVLI